MSAETRTVRVVPPPPSREGELGLPAERSCGSVLFAQGSGGSCLGPRNRFVAQTLQNPGLTTVLFELLTDEEPASSANVCDLELFADQLSKPTTGIQTTPPVRDLPLGYFGTGTGTAAALLAAASRPEVRAIVSRGGRPDLATDALADVTAPGRLIVGGDDTDVLPLNWTAYRRVRCERRLEVVPGATRLFEEPTAPEAVVALARHWLLQHPTIRHLTEQIRCSQTATKPAGGSPNG